MPAAAMLDRLQGVKQTGPDRWLAKCPAHEDKRPSLSIRELPDGRVLIHDFGGCGVDAVLGAVGLEMAALFPERLGCTHLSERAPRIPAADILAAVSHEVLVAACAASEMAKGLSLSTEDFERLCLASRRLNSANEVCNGKR